MEFGYRRSATVSIFRQIWERWIVVAQIIGDFIGRIILTVFYFTLFMPFGLGVRYLSDPLMVKENNHVEWEDRTTLDLTIDDVRRMS